MAATLSPRQVTADPGFDRLKQHLIEATGLAYYLDKNEDLATPIAQRLASLEISDCTLYLQRLLDPAGGEAELDVVTAALTIGETFFFRHRELFDALADRVLPELIERNRHQRRLRIWSAGCATGAEPYSLAILLEREFKERVAGWDISILGTDINRDFLAQAQRGQFNDWHLRCVSDEMKHACFSRAGSAWNIHDAFRGNVSFQYHNLVQHPFPSPVNNLFALDLILCRNVTIYFDAQIVCRLVRQFHESLIDGGWLLVGHAEPSVDLFRDFQTVNAPGAVLYQKQSVARPQPSPLVWTAPLVKLAASPPSANLSAASRAEAGRSASTRPRPQFPPANPARAVLRQLSVEPLPGLSEIRAHLDDGDWQAAAEHCRRLLATERMNPVLHFYHALVAQQLGSHHETEEALRRAIYLDRTFILAHYYLGLVLQRNRNVPSAKRSFRNALELLQTRDAAETFADADGLSVGALRQLTEMHLQVLQR